jgi:hypothetical protein
MENHFVDFFLKVTRGRESSPEYALRGCLVALQKFFTPSHRMFGHIYGVLNIDEKNN